MKDKALIGMVALAGSVGLAAWAAGDSVEAGVLSGAVEVRQQGGEWNPTSKLVAGQWLRSSRDGAVVRIPGVTARMDSGSSMSYTTSADHVALRVKGGNLYVKVDPSTVCSVVAGKKLSLTASGSEFVVDASAGKYIVASGSVVTQDKKASKQASMDAWVGGGSQSSGAKPGDAASSDDNDNEEDDEDFSGAEIAGTVVGAGVLVAIGKSIADSGDSESQNNGSFFPASP